MKLDRLKRMVSRTPAIGRLAQDVYRLYRQERDKERDKKECYTRLARFDASAYLDLSSKPDLNVVVIVVDCMGSSHLSGWGYHRQTTPFLDSIDQRMTAVSASTYTYPSVASVLTGLYPHNHGAVVAGKVKECAQPQNLLRMRDEVLSLPEALSRFGYEVYFGTAMSPAYWAVRARVVPRLYKPSARAEKLLADLTRWIARRKGEKFFAYVHLADLHIPLDLPDAFRHYFGHVRGLPNIERYDFLTLEKQEAKPEEFREYRENRVLLHDNALRYVDHAVERFYEGLRQMGLADSTLFVVTADHGEEFWEHSDLGASFYHQGRLCGLGHGYNLFNEVIQVPLLISGPLPGRAAAGLVSSVDIVPTVLDVLGVRHSMRLDGHSVFADVAPERYLLTEACASGYEKKALVIGGYKLIYSEDDGIAWLFDLERDPGERTPIVDSGLTSVYVHKLLRILEADERSRIRRIAERKGLSRAVRRGAGR